MSESNYTKKILPEWQTQHPEARVMRNNTGMAWQGEISYRTCTGNTERVIANPRPIFFGVGLPVRDKETGRIIQKGGSDWIGWESWTICDLLKKNWSDFPCQPDDYCFDCPLKKKVAIFLSLEIKSKDGKESPDQIKFRKTVQEAGGIAIVLKEGGK